MTPLITIDMDGTVYDPWMCCGWDDSTLTGTPACRHQRLDTWDRVDELQAATGAMLAVLSWRFGSRLAPTTQWLRAIGRIETISAFYMPGAPDDVSTRQGQIGHKVSTLQALTDEGFEIVGAFENSEKVLRAMDAEGFPAMQAHNVKLTPAMKRTGFAPKMSELRTKGMSIIDTHWSYV